MTNLLKDLIENKLLPWSQPGVLRWMVATSTVKELRLPPHIHARSRVMLSRAMPGPTKRQYRNASLIAKRWPDDHLSAHRFPKLLCVASGEVTIPLGKYEIDLPAGSFLFIPAGIPNPDGSIGHARNHQSAIPSDICWISPRGGELNLWLCRSMGQKHFTLSWGNAIFQSDQLMQYFNLLQQEARCNDEESPAVISHLLSLLLLNMQREIGREKFLNLTTKGNRTSRQTASVNPITLAKEYLDKNFGSAITIESLAREVGISRSQLARRFHEHTGSTVGEYLTERRIAHACRFLSETEWTITYIARFVGFRSVTYFHLLFQKRIGCSPLVFRQQNLMNRDDNK